MYSSFIFSLITYMHLHLYKSLHLNTLPSGKWIEGAFALWHSMCSSYLQNQFLEETCTCTLLKLLENLIYKIATTLHLDISLPKNLCSEFVTYLVCYSDCIFVILKKHQTKNITNSDNFSVFYNLGFYLITFGKIRKEFYFEKPLLDCYTVLLY